MRNELTKSIYNLQEVTAHAPSTMPSKRKVVEWLSDDENQEDLALGGVTTRSSSKPKPAEPVVKPVAKVKPGAEKLKIAAKAPATSDRKTRSKNEVRKQKGPAKIEQDAKTSDSEPESSDSDSDSEPETDAKTSDTSSSDSDSDSESSDSDSDSEQETDAKNSDASSSDSDSDSESSDSDSESEQETDAKTSEASSSDSDSDSEQETDANTSDTSSSDSDSDSEQETDANTSDASSSDSDSDSEQETDTKTSDASSSDSDSDSEQETDTKTSDASSSDSESDSEVKCDTNISSSDFMNTIKQKAVFGMSPEELAKVECQLKALVTADKISKADKKLARQTLEDNQINDAEIRKDPAAAFQKLKLLAKKAEEPSADNAPYPLNTVVHIANSILKRAKSKTLRIQIKIFRGSVQKKWLEPIEIKPAATLPTDKLDESKAKKREPDSDGKEPEKPVVKKPVSSKDEPKTVPKPETNPRNLRSASKTTVPEKPDVKKEAKSEKKKDAKEKEKDAKEKEKEAKEKEKDARNKKKDVKTKKKDAEKSTSEQKDTKKKDAEKKLLKKSKSEKKDAKSEDPEALQSDQIVSVLESALEVAKLKSKTESKLRTGKHKHRKHQKTKKLIEDFRKNNTVMPTTIIIQTQLDEKRNKGCNYACNRINRWQDDYVDRQCGVDKEFVKYGDDTIDTCGFIVDRSKLDNLIGPITIFDDDDFL